MSCTRARVAVVTPAIGHRFLSQAIASVRAQTHPWVTHWVVVDGVEFTDQVTAALDAAGGAGESTEILVLPQRTGAGGWNGHRVYGALPFLVEADYICYLDQDNWLEPDHVASLLDAIEQNRSPCAYSLRWIHDREGAPVCPDDCQSLGLLHGCYDAPAMRHVDTNCWLVSRQLAVRHAVDWQVPVTGDRALARALMARYPVIPCTRRYSVHYTAGNTAHSAPVEYFLRGNAVMAARYPTGLPWHNGAAGRPSAG